MKLLFAVFVILVPFVLASQPEEDKKSQVSALSAQPGVKSDEHGPLMRVLRSADPTFKKSYGGGGCGGGCGGGYYQPQQNYCSTCGGGGGGGSFSHSSSQASSSSYSGGYGRK